METHGPTPQFNLSSLSILLTLFAMPGTMVTSADTSPLLPATALTLPQPQQLTGHMLSEDKSKLMRQCAVVLGSVLLVFIHGFLLKRWLQLIA